MLTTDRVIKEEQSAKDLEVKDAQIANMEDDTLTSAKQREAIDEDIDLKKLQQKLTYVEQVIKDKEAAKLGLDNVVKVITTESGTFAPYTPKYEEVV
jgi:hypothetical protein